MNQKNDNNQDSDKVTPTTKSIENKINKRLKRVPTADEVLGTNISEPIIRAPVPRRVRDLALQRGAGVVNKDGTITIGGCEMTGAGLTVPKTITPDQMNEAMQFLVFAENQLAIWMGDLLVACEDLKYGDITAIALHFGIDPATARNRASICRRVKTSLRSDVLAQFPGISVTNQPQKSHYELVAAMDEDDQFYWLTQKIEQGWSYKQMREAIREATSETEPDQPVRTPFQKNYESLSTQIYNNYRRAQTEYSVKEVRKLIEAHRNAADQLEKLCEDVT